MTKAEDSRGEETNEDGGINVEISIDHSDHNRVGGSISKFKRNLFESMLNSV